MANNNIFKGKVILAYLINPSDEFAGGLAISDPRIEETLGRYFVVGKIPENFSDWTSGLRISVAFDQIAHYIEFEDENDFVEKAGAGINGIEHRTIQ